MDNFEYAKNGAVISTTTLIQQALHDKFRFGGKRLKMLLEKTERLTKEFYGLSDASKEKLFNNMRDELLDNVLNMQLADDFIIHLVKTLNVSGRPRKTAEYVIALTYVLMMRVLWKEFGFKKQDIVYLQKEIKSLVFIIKENKGVTIYCFMKCLKQECRMKFESLESYEAKYGKIDIGPKHAIYKT